MDAESIQNSAVFKLHRAVTLLDRLADEYLEREHGVRYAPFLVLLMVRVLGSTSQHAIAANLDVSRASITQRVAGLAQRGLLAVVPDPADSRANIVSLTPSGLALVSAAWDGLENQQNGLDRGVDEPALVEQLDRLIANAVALITKEAQ